MIALATLNTTLERALAVAKQPDKSRDARLTAHKRTRFAALTPDDFAAVTHARVLDTYRFVSAHVELPCPLHGQPLDGGPRTSRDSASVDWLANCRRIGTSSRCSAGIARHAKKPGGWWTDPVPRTDRFC